MFGKGNKKKRRDLTGDMTSLRLTGVSEAPEQGVIGALTRTSWVVHVLLLVLAGLIQWSIWRSVEHEERVDVGSLQVKLDGDALLPNGTLRLSEEYALVPGQSWENPTIVLNGPRNEILNYRDQLERAENEGSPSFLLLISPKDINTAEPTADEHTLVIRFDLEDFVIREALAPSDEVRLSFSDPDQEIEVLIERRVRVPAIFEVESFKVPEGYTPHAEVETTGFVEGPWSAIKDSKRSGDAVVVNVAAPDFAREFEAQGLSEEQRRAEWAKLVRTTGEGGEASGGLQRNLLIRRNERLSYFDGDQQPIESGKVLVDLWLSQTGAYEVVNLQDVPFDYLLPRWLIKKMPTLEIALDKPDLGVVTIEVLPEQRQYVNKENVRFVIDLRSIDEDDFARDDRPGADESSRSRTFLGYKVRLEVNRNLITSYKFPNSSVNENQYHTRDVTITYTDKQ